MPYPLSETDHMNQQATETMAQGQPVKPPLALTLDETHELLCKCEQQARDIADRILGPRPEATLVGQNAPLTGPELNSLRRSADHLRQRAHAIGNVLERISNGI